MTIACMITIMAYKLLSYGLIVYVSMNSLH